MELLSLRGHQIRVIGFDQLWREEKGSIISDRIVDEDISRFYDGAKVTFIRPFFLKIPLIDYITYLFSSWIEVKRQISDFEPDVIIGFSSIISNLWGAIYAKGEHIPYIYYWYDIVHTLNVPKPFGLIAILIEKIIIRRSTAILVINEALKDYIIEFGADPSITEVIPGGIDQKRFNPDKFDSKKIRSEFGFGDGDLVLFFMGWIYKFSGLDRVIIELYNSGEAASKIKLLIVGEGDYYQRLRSLVQEYSLEDRVIMTGKRPYEDIPGLIAASDICLLPAVDNEIMRYIVPIKMYEYLSMNKPVISTELQGILKEFGYNSGVIYIINPEDAIKKVLGLTNEDITDNSIKARLFIDKYGWDSIIDKFEIFLSSVLNSPCD
jgi:glycosyltransferase involved in cell wall biosynthesis